MKKSLLLCGLAVASMAVQAQENVVLEGVALSAISPDGKLAAGELQGSLTIKSLESDQEWSYVPDESGIEFYTLGLGNAVSNTGVVLLSTTGNCDATYWKDGEIVPLSVPYPEYSNMANGITPDGSVICGSIGLQPFSTESSTMLLPAVWELQADGTYGEAVVLPHPDKDFTGRDPQYITAISISDDGNTIIGQVRDYQGSVHQPIKYTRTPDGWEYTLLCPELINPSNYEFPEDPGESPDYPRVDDFLTPEEVAAYDQAYQDWLDECNETGHWDYSLMPSKPDFLSEEGRAAYDAAMEAYEIALAEWEPKYDAFVEVYWMAVDESVPFLFNNARISPDGKIYGTTAEVYDMMSWSTVYTPYVLSTDDDTYTAYTGTNISIVQVFDNGTLLAYEQSDTNPSAAWIKAADKDEFETLVAYMERLIPETGEWMKENMTHEMEVYDPETWEPMTVEMTISGYPQATPDFKTFVTFAENVWDWQNGAPVYSYLMKNDGSSKVVEVAGASKLNVKVAADGTVVLNGEAASLEVYTIEGRQVVNVANPAAVTATGLENGVYIVKVTDAEGNVAVSKVSL